MNFRILKVAAKLAIPACLAAIPAFAVDVTFSTAGYFCTSVGVCGSGLGDSATSMTFANGGNTVTISDTGVTDKTVTLGPSTFVSALTFTSTATAITDYATTANFSLIVSQSAPPAADYTDSATLTGTISFAGGPQLHFDNQTFVLNNITYKLGLTPGNIFNIGNPGVDPITNLPTPGISVLNMQILPEPTFYSLTALAFGGLLAVAVRRRKKVTGI